MSSPVGTGKAGLSSGLESLDTARMSLQWWEISNCKCHDLDLSLQSFCSCCKGVHSAQDKGSLLMCVYFKSSGALKVNLASGKLKWKAAA